MILKIKSLEISNIRDIAEKQNVTLRDSGLYSVVGYNEDDGGSNGAGKTSFVMSIAVGFFGAKIVDITNDEIKNRHSDGKAVIKINALVDEEPLYLERTIGGRIKLKYKTDELIEGSASDMQAKINDIIKVTPEQFLALSYKKQGDSNGFLLLTDSKKKDFLSSFFDLSAIDKAQEKNDEKYDQLKTRLATISAQIAEKTGAVAALESDVNARREAFAKLSLPEVKAVSESRKVDRNLLSSKIRELEDSLKVENPDVIAASEILNKYDTALSNAEEELFSQNNYLTQVQVLKAQIIEKEKIVHTSKNKQCIACNQNVSDAVAEAQCDTVHKDIEKLQKRIDNFLFGINQDLPVQVESLRKMKQQKSIELAELRNKYSKATITNTLYETRKSLSTIESLINSEQREFNAAEYEMNLAVSRYNACIDSIGKLSSEYELFKVDFEITQALTKVLSRTGFVGYIFDTILEELNYETNKNLKLIPNASKFTLNFSSDKIGKTTNNISKSINFKLWNNSDTVSLESLSGGERRSVIIAVDEALDSVLSRRTGIKIGWKFLDEPFDAIDINSKEALLDFYRNKSNDRLYFIIDHASELNAGLDHSITITKKNGMATIAC